MKNASDHSADLLAEIPEPGIELAPGVRAVPGGLRFQFSRGGGPGGQNVNKVNTKAELWIGIHAIAGLRPGAADRLRALCGRRLTGADEIHLSSHANRTQEANRADILERLREMIVAAQHQPTPRRKTRPSRASKRRRLEAKKHRSEIKSNRKQV